MLNPYTNQNCRIIEHVNDDKNGSTWNYDGGDERHLIASQKRPAKSRTQLVPHLAIVNEDNVTLYNAQCTLASALMRNDARACSVEPFCFIAP